MTTTNPTSGTPDPVAGHPRSARRRVPAVLVAVAALAGPAVALASQGADDPAGHDRTTTGATTGTTGASTPSPSAEASRRAKAVAAAQARVGVPTTLVRVRSKHGGNNVAYEVRLNDATFRWTVRLDRRYRVLRNATWCDRPARGPPQHHPELWPS